MKRVKFLLTTIAVLLGSVMANAYDFEVDGMYYNLHSATDLTVEVTYGENKYSGEVIIPSTITYQSRNLAVVGISSWAFGSDSELISITIPKSVVFIYQNSFKDCNSLKHLYIENGEEDILLIQGWGKESPFCDCPLESIYIGRDFTYEEPTHDPLFYQQTQLKSLTIGNGFAKIENDMFNDCTSLEEVYIEDGKSSLSLGYNDDYEGTGVFSDCPIKHLYLGRNLSYPKDRYNQEKVNLFSRVAGYANLLQSLTIGKCVSEIENGTFLACDSIQQLRIEDGNKTLKVSEHSFFLCQNSVDDRRTDLYLGRNLNYSEESPFKLERSIKSLIIGDSVTNINDRMFDQCFDLEKVTIGNNVVRVGNGAFSWCALSDITIPNSVTYLGDSVFMWTYLKSITLPDGLTRIANHAFDNCDFLQSVIIPNGVTSIGDYAFRSCALQSVIIPNGVTSIGDCAFSSCALQSITIPNGVTNIGRYAFAGCDFTTIIIPNSVGNIGERAFNNCDSLRSIYVEKATPITLNEDILSESAYINTNLYVPAGSLAAYQGADIWKNFWNIQEYYLDKKFCVNYFIDGELYAVDSVKHGDTIIPRAEPSKEGYTFSGWSEVPEIMPAEDLVVTGSFVRNTYTITYVVDSVVYATDSITYGDTIALLDEPTQEGYTFSGWSDAPVTMPAEDIIIEGSFNVNYYALKYIVDNEPFVTDSLAYGDTIILREEPQKEDFEFSGWSEVPETMPAHDVEVYGNFIFTSITDVKVDSEQSQKVVEDNQLFIILPNGKKFNIMGQEVSN